MPLYESICHKCNKVHDYIRSVSNHLDTPECCNEKTEQVILHVPMARFDIQPWDYYESPATGKVITSYAERREDMKASGCRDWEGRPAEKKMAARWREEEAKKEDAALEKEVGEVWRHLDHDKKQAILTGA